MSSALALCPRGVSISLPSAGLTFSGSITSACTLAARVCFTWFDMWKFRYCVDNYLITAFITYIQHPWWYAELSNGDFPGPTDRSAGPLLSLVPARRAGFTREGNHFESESLVNRESIPNIIFSKTNFLGLESSKL